MRTFLPLGIAAIAIVTLLMSGSDSTAYHSEPDNDPNYNWVNTYLMYDFYPSNDWPNWGNGPYRDHNLRYRVCTSYGDEGGYAAWDWTRRFGFNSGSTLTATLEPNCGASSDVLFWLTTEDNVRSLAGCNIQPGESTPVACFRVEASVYDSFLGRDEVKRATIPVWKWWVDTYGYAIHIFEHELGHGMGLAHHSACTNYVMENAPCNGWWVADGDITTARCLYIYAC